MSNNAFLRSLQPPTDPRQRRIKARKLSKYRRSPNHWKMHGDVTFTKIELRESERIWLEVHMPHVTPKLIRVEDAHRYPRFRAGLWDGYVYKVEFPDRRQASQFKNFVWNLRV
jgi:hypothetical protein